MKAFTFNNYGSPDEMKLEEVANPILDDNKILVKIHATSVNAGDWHVLRADPFLIRLFFGLFKPKYNILGADISGTVEAVGKNVRQFQPGDEVFGNVSECGWGGFADYVAACEDSIVTKPPGLSFEEAAAVPQAAVTALQALRDKGQIQAGKKVLINGASGGVGTFAVQIAKAFGAEVTGVCSTRNLDKVRSLGADFVIDYTKEDFTKNGQQYDLILAIGGYHPIADYKRALSEKGVYVQVGGSDAQTYQAMLLGPWISLTGKKKMGNMLHKPNQKDLIFVKELIEKGKIMPVVDRQFPFGQVPDAIRYIEEGHPQGKVVVSV